MKTNTLIALAMSTALVACASRSAGEPPVAFAHPIFAQPFSCIEHWAGNLRGLGDSLGTDCGVVELVESDGRKWLRSYRSDGLSNQDWFTWQKEVLSPCDCLVVRVREVQTVNAPGVPGQPPASYTELRQTDGTHFVLAHLVDFRVKEGQTVERGQVLGLAGNNGYSRNPHVHLGAWRHDVPLQIRFDLQAMGMLFR